MADTLTFYTNPMSRGRIVRWTLEEVGAPYDTVVLDYATTMKAPEYLSVNPMGKVPAIVHNGAVVTECAAICAYLADAFPDAGLAPALGDRDDYYRWLFYAAGPIEQAAIDKARKIEVSAEQSRMVGYGSLDAVVDTIERAVTGRDHIAGDRFSAADLYVGSHLMWGAQFGWLPKRDALTRYIGKLAERPAYKRAGELDDALMPQPDESAA